MPLCVNVIVYVVIRWLPYGANPHGMQGSLLLFPATAGLPKDTRPFLEATGVHLPKLYSVQGMDVS